MGSPTPEPDKNIKIVIVRHMLQKLPASWICTVRLETMLNYTVVRIFARFWPIFKILSLIHSTRILQYRLRDYYEWSFHHAWNMLT